jgi:hypothetical protein
MAPKPLGYPCLFGWKNLDAHALLAPDLQSPMSDPKNIFVLASDDILVALTREIGTEFLDCQLKMCDRIPNYFVKMHCAPAGP